MASDIAPAGGPAAGGTTSGPAQPLAGLTTVDPADFGSHLAQAGPASEAALASEQAASAGQLPSRPTPTGLPVSAAQPLPTAIEPASPPAITVGSATDDAGNADEIARQGAGTVTEAAAATQMPLPQTAAMIQPTSAPAPLPAIDLAAAPAGSAPPAPIAVAGSERTALNASMGEEVRQATGQAIEPALATSSAHAADVSATGSATERSLTAAETEAAAQQQDAAGHADAEVRELHAGWQREKAEVAGAHQDQIQSEAGQARSEAERTMAEAQTQAKAEAAKQPDTSAQRDAEPSLWDRVTSTVGGVVSGVGQVAAGAMNVVRGIIDSARQRVAGLMSRLGQAIRDRVATGIAALRAGVRRVGSAIADTIRRGRDLVGRIAATLAATAQRIWQAARQRLTQLWAGLTAAVSRAIAAAAAIARRITDALGKVKQIVQLLGNQFLGFLAEAATNPEEKIGKPLVAIAAPLVGEVPAKAEQQGKQMRDQGGPARAKIPVQRRVAPAPPVKGETFWQGAERHMKAAGETFLEHWAMNLMKVVASIVAFPAAIGLELGPLWEDIKGVFTPKPGGGDRLDHYLGVCRHIVSMAGLLVAGVGVWAFLIGLVFPPSEPFLAAGYYALSIAVLAADLLLGAAQMLNSYEGASNAKSQQQREMYLGMFSNSLIGFGITAVLTVLGAIAARVAKGFRAPTPEATGAGAAAPPVEGATPAPAEGSAPVVEAPPPAPVEGGSPAPADGAPPVVEGDPPVRSEDTSPALVEEPPVSEDPPTLKWKRPPGRGEAIGEPAATDVGARGGPEPRPQEWPYQNPPNMRTVPPGTPLDLGSLNPKAKYLWVVDAEGNFKYAPETQNSTAFDKPVPPDTAIRIKHGDLSPGDGGYSRGAARAGGEMYNVRDAQGKPTDMWCIDNDSSYTFRRIDENGRPLPPLPAESIEAVRQHLIDGGTPGEKLVTTDVLARHRPAQGGGQ